MFKLFTNTIEGIAEAAINTVKVPLGVVIAPLDDGKTIQDGVEGIVEGVNKIGKSEEKK